MNSIGIIGYGHFGSLLKAMISRFAPWVKVKVFSSKHEPDGKDFFSFEEVAQCDAVALAVPIHNYEETLKRLVPLLGARTIIIDIATVKVYTTTLLAKIAEGKRYISTHPMFGPESYSKKIGDVSGFRIVITPDYTISKDEYEILRTFLQSCGFKILEMTADEHDIHLAETLFLTHFLGQIVARAGFDRTAIDTVSFGFLMDAVESVKHDSALFTDVFTFNPYCSEVLKKFDMAEHEVMQMIEARPKIV